MHSEPRVYVSQVIPAPVEDVWARARAFDSIDEWHPVIENATMEDGAGSTEIGGIRNFDAGGRTVREELVAFSENDHSYVYTMAGDGGNKEGYLAELSFAPITEAPKSARMYCANGWRTVE